MIKEKLVFVRQTNGIERRYNYKIIEGIIKETLVYGIEIERVDYKGDVEIDRFKDSVELISTDFDKIRNLLVMLYENGVSPLHLIDIAGEFIDNSVSDFKGTRLDEIIYV